MIKIDQLKRMTMMMNKTKTFLLLNYVELMVLLFLIDII